MQISDTIVYTGRLLAVATSTCAYCHMLSYAVRCLHFARPPCLSFLRVIESHVSYIYTSLCLFVQVVQHTIVIGSYHFRRSKEIWARAILPEEVTDRPGRRSSCCSPRTNEFSPLDFLRLHNDNHIFFGDSDQWRSIVM